SGAGFADQRHRAVLRDVERDALHRVEGRVPVEAKRDAQIPYADQRFHLAFLGQLPNRPLSFGSSASRSASVKSANAVTRIAIAVPAAASCHHLPSISSFCASFSIEPHDTTSTGTPNPRNDRMTSDLMNATTRIDICTSTTCDTLGKMCMNIRRAFDAPSASAACTYSRALCFKYSARSNRNVPVQPVSPRIRMIVRMPFCCRTAATARTSSRYGIELNTL